MSFAPTKLPAARPPAPKPRGRPNNAEHQHQCALVAWAYRCKIPPHPTVVPGSSVGSYLFAIPNGGHRSKATAGKLKAEGVKAGVLDMLLPLGRSGFLGLWIEMKAPGKIRTVSKEQRDWIDRMALAGYAVEVCDDWITAATVIARYLGVPPPHRIPPT